MSKHERKYTEEAIEKAYEEFRLYDEGKRRWLSNGSHEAVAFDYLSQNMHLEDFLAYRNIDIITLYFCIRTLTGDVKKERRDSAIMTYCVDNNIFYTRYDELDHIYKTKDLVPGVYSVPGFVTPRSDNGRVFLTCEEVIEDLNQKLITAKAQGKVFGIMEYCSFYSLSIILLKEYLDMREEFKMEYERVRSFIEGLDLSGEIIPIEEKEVVKKQESELTDFYICEDTLRDIVTYLKLQRIPILTGTLNRAVYLHQNGELGSLSKQKIKTKYENRV